jgi:hypothetical protein
MIDKDRQRRRASRAPQGRVPTWLLLAVAGAVTTAAVLARSLV